MNRVVILPDTGQPDGMKALLARVAQAAGDHPFTVGHGGVVMSEDLARVVLASAPGDDVDTSGHTVDNTRAPMPTLHVGEDGEAAPVTEPDSTLTHGGRTPAGEIPGGVVEAPEQGAAPEPEPEPTPRKAATARKSTPAKKTTAAAQQRASRSSRE